MSCKHIMMIEFTQTYSFVDVPMVALYNETRISEEEVRNKIVDGTAEHSDFIVVMFKSQYENLKDLILEQQGGII